MTFHVVTTTSSPTPVWVKQIWIQYGWTPDYVRDRHQDTGGGRRGRRDALLLLPLCPRSHKTPREVCFASSSSTAGSSTQSHLLALLFTVILKSSFKSLHWELCFPLSTLIWLHKPPTRFAPSPNGRGEELNRSLSSCSRLSPALCWHRHTCFSATSLLK